MQIYRRLGTEQKAFCSKAFYRAMGSDLASNPIKEINDFFLCSISGIMISVKANRRIESASFQAVRKCCMKRRKFLCAIR